MRYFPQRSRLDHYLILGLPKTGTSALFYAIEFALRQRRQTVWQRLTTARVQRVFEPRATALPTPKPGRTIISKVLWEHFDVPHLKHYMNTGAGGAAFNKRIAIIRDPRDQLISDLLYMPHALLTSTGDMHREPSLRKWVELLEMKESAPASISVTDLAQALPGRTWQIEQGLEILSRRHLEFARFVRSAENEFHICKYEDFIGGHNELLDAYLNFRVVNNKNNPEIPAQIKRSAASENWRLWLTEKDVQILRPSLSKNLAAYGYDMTDWRLASPSRLDPTQGSRYVSTQLDTSMMKLRAVT